MNDLVSVIVPIYKAEIFLNKCVDSIINQSYKNIEIILVDDGSPDNCPKLCDEYAKKDSRIVVIHKPNGGVSSARNAGIKTCHGKYICFVDSDDQIKPNYVNTLYTTLIDKNVDFVVCNADEIDANGVIHNYPQKNRYFDRTNNFKDMFLYLQENVLSQPWNKIFIKSKITSLFDESISYGEDEYFTQCYINNCKSIYYIDESLYIYNYFDSSLAHQKELGKYKLRAKNIIDHSLDIVKTISKDDYFTNYYVIRTLVKQLFRIFNKAYNNINNKDELIALFDEMCSDSNVIQALKLFKSKSLVLNYIANGYKKHKYKRIMLLCRVRKIIKH